MKERPIIFSTDMVKAILEGRKTQTRRVIKPQPPRHWSIPPARFFQGHFNEWGAKVSVDSIKCPYGQAGDRLWVRETWATEWEFNDYKPSLLPKRNPSDAVPFVPIAYTDTDWDGYRVGRTRPSIFMPRWASRITLEITEVRVERLQEITEDDAEAEGCVTPYWGDLAHQDLIGQFQNLWDSLNAKRGYSWKSNPWVWVIGFKPVA